jgi:hypothetical protein
MTKYYVSKAGSDTTADATDASTPLLTIEAGLRSASSDSDIVEILDEGIYTENDLNFAANYVTIQHTASDIGRASISGHGSAGHAFAPDAYGGVKLIGLEVGFYTNYVFNKLGSGYDRFTLSGCFIHSVPHLGSHTFDGSASEPISIEQSVLFFEPAANEYCISNSGYMEISNCLITSSTSTGLYPVLRDWGNFGTASFSTIINRSGSLTDPIVRFAKVINCIVTGSGKGIASGDHTYNLVHVASSSFLDPDGVTLSATGSTEFGDREPMFVDGDAVGKVIAIAENYQLEATSYAYDAGIAFDGIIVDITGSTRVVCDYKPDMGCFERLHPVWTEHEDEAYDSFEGDFTINDNKNLSSNYKYGDRNCENPKQPPFSKGIKGPANLRGRTKAYVTSNGGKPDEISN